MPFEFHALDIPGPLLIEPRRFPDERGWFMEFYKQSDFRAAGIAEQLVQDNVSFSSRGVLRGLHYQVAPAAQAKLVSVLHGEIFDVAVDIRPQSETYGRWIGHPLSAHSGAALYIPAGFAHGFVVTSADALVCYKCSAEYNHACERGIIWNDPSLGIEWPISDPIVSDKDRLLPLLPARPPSAGRGHS